MAPRTEYIWDLYENLYICKDDYFPLIYAKINVNLVAEGLRPEIESSRLVTENVSTEHHKRVEGLD
jgi:hypothetical protein